MSATKGKKLEAVTCPLCGVFSSKRLTQFETHLQEIHETNMKQVWDDMWDGPKLCACGCKAPAPWKGWKLGYGQFILGHNANIYSSYSPEIAALLIKQRSDSLKGKPSWAKGLTKESDTRIEKRAKATSVGRKAAFNEKRIEIWNKGLTSETDDRIKTFSEKIKLEFSTGERKAWGLGLSEATDPRILKKNLKLREAYAAGRFKAWHAGKTTAEDPRISKFWANRDAMLEFAHVRWTDAQIETMLESNSNTMLESIQAYKNGNYPSIHIACRTCAWKGFVTLPFARTDTCPVCCPRGSKAEREIGSWLDTILSVPVGKNVRGLLTGKQELDIYVPTHKLAIEYNGLYWHSEVVGRGAQYHQQKSDRCKAIGVSLIHIYEDEWRNKSDIIRSMIVHKLGLSEIKVGARKCSIRDVLTSERRDFFNKNHIDGDTIAKFAIGLDHKDHGLVAVMSAREPFHKKHIASLEIARMATAKNTIVSGGLGKLTNEMMKRARLFGVSSLISYVDTRFGSSISWESVGWKLAGETTPRFWWTDFKDRMNRFRFRADKSRNMTEAQVAEEAGVVRIYGCKNLTLELPVKAL